MIKQAISAFAAALFVALVVCRAGSASAQEAYRLGEGDVVKLNVFQRPDLSAEERLGPQDVKKPFCDAPGGPPL